MINKPKLLTIVVVALLLLNFGTLGFMWTHSRGPGGPPDGPGHRPDLFHFMVNELQMTKEQEAQYDVMRRAHHEKVVELQEASRKLHDKFFNLLQGAETDSILVNQLADSIASNQKQVDLITFRHFQQVRSICTPPQQKKFDEVIDEAMSMMAPRPPHR